MLLVQAITALSMLAGVGMASAGISPEGFESDPRLGEETNRVCFARTIRGFSDPTETTVVIEARTNTFYLLETRGSCQNLEFAKRMSFDESLSCIRTNDRFGVSDSVFASGFGPGGGTCQIRAMYEWDPEAGEGETAEAAATER